MGHCQRYLSTSERGMGEYDILHAPRRIHRTPQPVHFSVHASQSAPRSQYLKQDLRPRLSKPDSVTAIRGISAILWPCGPDAYRLRFRALYLPERRGEGRDRQCCEQH